MFKTVLCLSLLFMVLLIPYCFAAPLIDDKAVIGCWVGHDRNGVRKIYEFKNNGKMIYIDVDGDTMISCTLKIEIIKKEIHIYSKAQPGYMSYTYEFMTQKDNTGKKVNMMYMYSLDGMPDIQLQKVAKKDFNSLLDLIEKTTDGLNQEVRDERGK